MTVSSSTARSGPYAGNGATTEFAYAFKVLEAAHLAVFKTSTAGVEELQVLNTHYTVAGVGDDSGSVVMLTPPAAGEKITIVRDVPLDQETDYRNQGAYYPETVEDALDKLTMAVQQLNEAIARTVKVSVSGETDPDELVAALYGARDAAAASAAAAAASYDLFDDRFLGSKAGDPETDNDGNALVAGAIYFDTTANALKVYTGAGWSTVPSLGNLAELADVQLSGLAANQSLVYDGAKWANVLTGLLNAANTWTALQTFRATGAASDVCIERNDANGAVDRIGQLSFVSRSSADVNRFMAGLIAEVINKTDGGEDAELQVVVRRSGSAPVRATFGQGLYMAGATGGDPGAGGVNAAALKQNGVALGALAFLNTVSSADINASAVINSKIADATIQNAKLANMSAGTLKGRVIGSSGAPQDLSPANAKAIIAATGGIISRSGITALSGSAPVVTDLGGVSDPQVIILAFNNLSTTGAQTDDIEVRIGDAGGVESSGYGSNSWSSVDPVVISTSGFILNKGTSADFLCGAMILLRVGGATWTQFHVCGDNNHPAIHGAGIKALDGPLDRIQLACLGGSFNNGSVTVFAA